MSWKEAEEAFKISDMALLPIGTLHGHGPTPISVDYTSVEKIADEVGKRTGILTLPVIPYGENDKQKYYPGSISISPETLERYYVDIFKSLRRNGIRRVLVLNGHGGNREALMRAARVVRKNGMIIGIQEWWKLGKLLPKLNEKGCHIVELAVALAIDGIEIADVRPGVFKGEWGDPPDHPIATKNIFGDDFMPLGFDFFNFKGSQVIIPIHTWDLDVDGPESVEVKDLAELSEMGNKLLELVVDYVVDLAEVFAKMPLEEALKSQDDF
jgi:creatinine amidohydrolase